MTELGYTPTLVAFGERAGSKEKSRLDPAQAYVNRRAQMYGETRERMRPREGHQVFAIRPGADMLRAELAILPLLYDSEGRMRLPPKDKKSETGEPSLRQLLGRSPDRADSLVLAVHALGRIRRRYGLSEEDMRIDESVGRQLLGA